MLKRFSGTASRSSALWGSCTGALLRLDLTVLIPPAKGFQFDMPDAMAFVNTLARCRMHNFPSLEATHWRQSIDVMVYAAGHTTFCHATVRWSR